MLGLGHCVRLEAHGDYVRWLLDAHHPSSALIKAGNATAEPLLSAEKMIAIAGKLDLVNNIFENGVHGSLRSTLVEVRRLYLVSACSDISTSPVCACQLSIQYTAFFKSYGNNSKQWEMHIGIR